MQHAAALLLVPLLRWLHYDVVHFREHVHIPLGTTLDLRGKRVFSMYSYYHVPHRFNLGDPPVIVVGNLKSGSVFSHNCITSNPHYGYGLRAQSASLQEAFNALSPGESLYMEDGTMWVTWERDA